MPNRLDLTRALTRAEATLRWIGSLTILPGWVRFRSLQRANDLARLLDRLRK